MIIRLAAPLRGTVGGEKTVPVEGAEEPLGFFVLRASDRAEALKLSMGCPHLRYGGRVELRPFVVRPGPS